MTRALVPRYVDPVRPVVPRYLPKVSAMARVMMGAAPLKNPPTIVTQKDIVDYLGIVVALIKSLNDDMLSHLVYLDYEAEQNRVEELLAKARDIDGCEQGLTCGGWREDDPPKTVQEAEAAPYRIEAFQHRVDARLMEERIDHPETTGRLIPSTRMTKAQRTSDLLLYTQWREYIKRFDTFLANSTFLTKPSDFEEAQRLDLEYQGFRDRYTGLTGLQPSAPLPPIPPEPKGLLDKIPVTALLVIGGLFAVGYAANAAYKAFKSEPAPSPVPATAT